MTKISFELFGLTLLEPMAFLFNWLLMVQSIIYYRQLSKYVQSRFSSIFNWFFFFMAISFFLGGITHLTYHYTGQTWKIPGWIAALLAVSAVEYAVALNSKTSLRFPLVLFTLFKLTLLGSLTIITLSFTYVMIHTSFLLLFLLVPAITKRAYYQYFALGIFFLLAALPVKILELDLHAWFNRDDISHALMLGTLWSFCRGIRFVENNHTPALVKP